LVGLPQAARRAPGGELRIRGTGAEHRRSRELSRSDILLQASRYEAFALTVAEALASFEIEKGFAVGAIISEPAIIDPVAMAIDEDGRLFVVEPLTALTFTVYVPVGVPGLGGGPWLPPPLQPGATTISPNSSKTKSPRRRRCLGNPTRTIEKISPAPEIHRVKKDCAKK